MLVKLNNLFKIFLLNKNYIFRSAVLVLMGENSAALRDIFRSLSGNYPQHLNHKLFERKAKCLIGLKLFAEAVKAFEEAEEV